MSGPYAAPAGPPPPPQRQSSIDDAIPDEPPPAYTPAAGPQGDTALQSGPARMDFSGPPPLPDRRGDGQAAAALPPHSNGWQASGPMEAQITGVGVGYGRRTHGQDVPPEVYQSPTGPPPNLPPRHPSASAQGANPFSDGAATAASNITLAPSSSAAGPSRPPPPKDTTPTDTPTPGRPLLRDGQLLVYPKGHRCQKCGNTGYKNADPSNPCNQDWRKYGKAYNAALAASYSTASGPLSNPTLSASSNFQQPLPNLQPPQHNAYGGGGGWNQYPGQNPHAFRPPPPTPAGMGMASPNMAHFAPPPPPIPHPGQIFVQHTLGPVPPGTVVVQPGDPRIGGRPCLRCGGHGRELSFFGFDDGRCWECRGLGRLFH